MTYQPTNVPVPGLPPSDGPLTRRQKAAVVIHLLVSGGADPGLRDLPPDQQRQLVDDMARLRFIDRGTLADIIAEFSAELDSIGLHFPRDRAKVLALLESQLSLDVVDAMTNELGNAALPGSGPWTKISELDAAGLKTMIDGESDEVCAVLLSKLPATRAAELMQLLPPERADRIAAAFAKTEDVTPTAVAQIGIALGRERASRKPVAFATDGVQRVGNILNAATSGVRRAILASLEATHPDFAARVRFAVFSFENIADRISPRDLPKVLRGLDGSVIVTALAGAADDMAEVVDFILGSISKRMADQFREEIGERDPPTPEETELAMSEIVAMIRKMEDDGELTLNAPEG